VTLVVQQPNVDEARALEGAGLVCALEAQRG
jgi:hypothetical protein